MGQERQVGQVRQRGREEQGAGACHPPRPLYGSPTLHDPTPRQGRQSGGTYLPRERSKANNPAFTSRRSSMTVWTVLLSS